MYHEKDFQSDFTKWLRLQAPPIHHTSSAYELKCKPYPKPLNYKNDFQPQQIPKLIQAQDSCVYKKLSDLDPSLKPFDALLLCNAKSYLVMLWYEPRKPKQFFMIPINNLITHQQTNKSLKPNQAHELAEYVYIL